jgi:hypothetical protein
MLKSTLIFIHLLSFATSFGLVIFTDILMMQIFRTGRINQLRYEVLLLCSKFISGSLCILILSGLLFLVYYRLYEPALLANPKLYAKMLVVSILAINGVWLHLSGLKQIRIGLTHDLRAPSLVNSFRKLLYAGSLSGVSWWTAFGFGVFGQLNFTFSFYLLVGLYFFLVGICFVGTELYLRILYKSGQANPKLKPGFFAIGRSLLNWN